MATALYAGPDLKEFRIVSHASLDETTERHRIEIAPGPMARCDDALIELAKLPDLAGLIVEMERGWPGQSQLRAAKAAIRSGRRAWLYWPHEKAIECMGADRLRTYWRLWAYMTALRTRRKLGAIKERVLLPFRVVKGILTGRPYDPNPAPPVVEEHPGKVHAERSRRALGVLEANARPVPFRGTPAVPQRDHRVAGIGAYLRTDFWANITSGGSYGHTCYVAKELAAVTDRFICFMGSRFAMLDDIGLHQVVMPRASETSSETDLLAAHWFYYPQLKVAFQAIKPAYIYERLCQANFCGAALSQELGIPYIVEYNGSEISMTKSFGGVDLLYEDVFIRAEDVAFKQATLITVVSQVVKQSLVDRGVDADKILVNPNGADPEVYAPMAQPQRDALRAELGFTPQDRVIGFTGTFGGWHGIDVLADAIPAICERAPSARFLLVGDGTHKHLVDASVAKHGLIARVKSMGRVPQEEGARLLAACDVFVSPHNSHMVDSKFFGSPTKLFEYMAVGEGIVGSDLEQLGEVLSPALRLKDFAAGEPAVTNERAMLCTPGDVDEFAGAVVALVQHPKVATALGRNARQSVLDSFSWQRHVENVWRFASGERAPAAIRTEATVAVTQVAQPLPGDLPQAMAETTPTAAFDLKRVATGDAYKEEVQDQWNNNPVGSHYAKTTRAHTLEWYLEVEAYRYGTYSPWAFELMEFGQHAGHKVLEIGGGLGTDLSMFARHGAIVTDVDLSAGHLAHAQENFALRGLKGEFVHHDAEGLPFPDNTFDVVYSNGVIHHTPNTHQVVREIRRVLKPGGKAIVMVYAEHSLHYWYRLVWEQGIKHGLLHTYSIGEIMSRKVEITENDARPLVKVYTARALRGLFEGFENKQVFKRQMVKEELPEGFEKWISLERAGRWFGWNVIIKANKPRG
ncbi:MAG TPA: methyltransferase domain-containing protein [Vicinamibacterales bacterium]|nr:methyltransferase domain-containing protein [Vicinamibacterales bacterium]